MTAKNAAVRIKREMVSLLGTFIQGYQGDIKPDSPLEANISLCEFRDQIVDGMPNHLDTREITRRNVAAHVNTPVNVRRVRFAAGKRKRSAAARRKLAGGADKTMLP